MKRLYRVSPKERSQIRDQFTAELSQCPEVLFAYAYGSCIGTQAFHGIDIGVYLSGSTINADVTADLSQHLSGKVKLPVDVRILNTAPISFRFHVLRGECLFSRDDDLRTDIMEDTMRRYLDIAPLLRHAPPRRPSAYDPEP
jgi:predicted nucleotidyltransferase